LAAGHSGRQGAFALAGLIAAFAAPTPASALLVALLLAGVACLGAGVAPALYLRAAAPAVGFLGLSGLTLLLAIDSDFSWRWAPEAWPRVAALTARSLAALAALLGLVLTTPLPDLIGLLRRLRCPALLLDLMVLCYRMLFVLGRAARHGHRPARPPGLRVDPAGTPLARPACRQPDAAGLAARPRPAPRCAGPQRRWRAAPAQPGICPRPTRHRLRRMAGALLVILARLAA
jgi:hypothetical protein